MANFFIATPLENGVSAWRLFFKFPNHYCSKFEIASNVYDYATKEDRIGVEKAGEERSVDEELEEEGWMLEDGGAMKKRRSRFGS